jgi:hypothetical protein
MTRTFEWRSFHRSHDKSQYFYHDLLFPNFVMIKAMEEKGGCVNYTAIDILWDLEWQYWIHAELLDKKRLRSVLDSKSDSQRAAKRIETIADMTLPMTPFHTASGEGEKFENVEAVIALLIKAYGLHEATKVCPIEISSSDDAALVTKTLTSLTQGIEMTVMGAFSTWTGRSLCLSALRGSEWDTEYDPITLASRDEIQSRNEMYPLTISFGKTRQKKMWCIWVKYMMSSVSDKQIPPPSTHRTSLCISPTKAIWHYSGR